MFTTKLTRAAHRASTTSSSSTAAAISTCTAHHCPRPTTHQRRQSSSKTSSSWPPSDNGTGKPAPAAKTSSPAATTDSPLSASKGTSKSTKSRAKGGYKRVGQVGETAPAKKSTAAPIDQYAGLPSVPVLSSLRVEDLTLSKFFSLHRPVSVTTTIPPPTTPESFSSLFTNRQQVDPWANGNSAERRPEDVIYSLRTVIDALENGTRNSEDDGVRWEVIHESPSNTDGVKHLDGAPLARIRSLEELVATFRPFKPPPPPQPFPSEASSAEATEKKAAGVRGRPKRKTYTATITVTEDTLPDGRKKYSASSSPIVRLRETAESRYATDAALKRSFRLRLAQRKQSILASWNEPPATRSEVTEKDILPDLQRRAPSPLRQQRIRKFYMISVKRQRKLKMKKHKYKKLMKRTRNLRRRQDRT